MHPDPDVLGGGPRRPPRRWPVLPAPSRRARLALTAAVAVLVAAVGLPALRAGVRPPAVPGPAALPYPAVVPTSPLPQVPALQVQEVCPVVTDHRRTVDVSFLLFNASAGVVTLESVRPLLPLPDLLRPVGAPLVRRGGCAGTGEATPRRTLVPRDALLITFRFAIPGGCPAPAPVDAAVRERTADDRVLDARAGVLPDLGGTPFDAC